MQKTDFTFGMYVPGGFCLKKRKTRGSGTEPGVQVRTRPTAIPFLPQLPRMENYAI